jgi:uncharacterized protein YraI
MTSQVPSSSGGGGTPTENQGNNSSGNTVLTVFLVIIGVVAVLGIGILLGRALGDTPEVPPSAGAPTVVPPPPAPEEPYLTANEAVNVRSGPSTDYPAYGILPQGQSAPVAGVSPDGGWWAILLPAGYSPEGYGWVSAAYVTAYNTAGVSVIQPPQVPPEVMLPIATPGTATCTAAEPINVRSGPGNEYPSYGVVPIGTTGTVIGVSEDSGWWMVSVPPELAPKGQAWVSTSYCLGQNTEGVPVIPSPQ